MGISLRGVGGVFASPIYFLRLQRARSLIARGNVCGKVLLRKKRTSCRHHVNRSCYYFLWESLLTNLSLDSLRADIGCLGAKTSFFSANYQLWQFSPDEMFV